MSEDGYRIEFEPGDVIRPEFDPENNLIALDLAEEGFESLREAVCEPNPPDESGEDGSPEPGSEPFRVAHARMDALEQRIIALERAVEIENSF